jgi:hypothetical protein
MKRLTSNVGEKRENSKTATRFSKTLNPLLAETFVATEEFPAQHPGEGGLDAQIP